SPDQSTCPNGYSPRVLGSFNPKNLRSFELGAKTRTRPRNPASLQNLAQRPARPAQGNGRVQVAAKRVLDLFPEVSTAQAIEFSHAARILLHGLPLKPQHYRAVRRALRQVGAIPVGRGGGMGRPIVWRLPD